MSVRQSASWAKPAYLFTSGDAQLPISRRDEGHAYGHHQGHEIFYKDWGTGQPIVFSHGWPLSADDWDAQMLFFKASV
jgi:hypothetical protein